MPETGISSVAYLNALFFIICFVERKTAMDTNTIYELIGYFGSALVVISMLMTSVVRLRIINLIGSVIFTCYALIIRSYPTAAMNLFLIGINIYHLFRLLKTKKIYELIPASMDDSYISWLLKSYLEDIREWFPEFDPDKTRPDIVWLACCEKNPASLFLAADLGNGKVEVLLDYATPVYRDTSAGRFFYSRLAEEKYRAAVFRQNAPKHVGYMEKVGYEKISDGEYVLDLQKVNAAG